MYAGAAPESLAAAHAQGFACTPKGIQYSVAKLHDSAQLYPIPPPSASVFVLVHLYLCTSKASTVRTVVEAAEVGAGEVGDPQQQVSGKSAAKQQQSRSKAAVNIPVVSAGEVDDELPRPLHCACQRNVGL